MEELENKEEVKIDFSELEKEGFIKQRQEGLFFVRVKSNSGMLNPEQLTRIAELTKLYGEGSAHLTVRQEIEVPGIRHENINLFREGLVTSGLSVSKGGFSVKAVVSCPGVKWCARSWVDSVAVAETIDKEFYGKEQFAKLANK
ncbi:MAG: coenzyme F420 hydrogenase, partial [Candidatus Omnitrophica bacterium]|nr:coenzyme F420 hydrogenase [Candidatus Omnitrophota bacterium]